MTQGVVAGLFIYPIKSCAGLPVSSASLVPGGLEYDRRYMLVDEAGRFITARTAPQLLQVSVKLRITEHFDICAQHHSMSEALYLSSHGPQEFEERQVLVWRDQPWARVCSAGSDWFSSYLGRRVQLVYLPSEQLRQVNPERSQPGDVVSFADGYPLLLTSQESLLELNARLAHPIGMERFRPNVVVQGTPAYDEDTWARISIADIQFDAPKLCDRCVITTFDSKTSHGGKEPLKTLAQYRKWSGAVWFGANLIGPKVGQISVGDPVHPLQRRPHPRDIA